MEKRGVATVGIVAQTFLRDAKRTAETFGLPGLGFAVVPDAFTSTPHPRIREMVDGVIGQIEERLTTVSSAAPAESEIVTHDEWLSFEAPDTFEAVREMNAVYLRRHWSDGLLLWPPTRYAMDAMLAATSRDPDEPVAILEPGFGIATPRKIAANAIMAGCRPEHLPVVIAAVEALADPQINVRDKSMSTGMAAPLLIINGPIRTRIGLNMGICALGPGSPSHVNTVIGRALRLCMMNVGHSYPGLSDMDTIGSPMKYSMCIGENEEESPWGSYAADRGHAPETSTVTVQFAYGHCDFLDMWNTEPEKILQGLITGPKFMGPVSHGLWLVGRRADPRSGTAEKEHNFLVLSPSQANGFQKHGWDKRRLQEELWRHSRATFKQLIHPRDPKMFAQPHLSWLWDSPDTMLPILEDPDCFGIVVSGKGISRDAYFWGMGGPVTKVITD